MATIDTIKDLLNITDTLKDAMLNHKIAYYQLLINDYCFEDTFPVALEPILVELVMSYMNTSTITSTGVKSIKRGDTEIQYGGSGTTNTKYAELSPYFGQLSYHRRIRVGGM